MDYRAIDNLQKLAGINGYYEEDYNVYDEPDKSYEDPEFDPDSEKDDIDDMVSSEETVGTSDDKTKGILPVNFRKRH